MDDRRPSVQAAEPLDDRPRREACKVIALVLAAAGKAPQLAERVLVGQAGNPLADGELAASALALDALRAAHLAAQVAAPFEFVDLRLPGHMDNDSIIRSSRRAKAIPQVDRDSALWL